MFELVALGVESAGCLENLHGTAFEPGWSAREFCAHLNNEFDDVIGASSDTGVTGFIVIRTQSEQSEILTMIVDTNMRGQGLGKKLLAAAENAAVARGADIMFLDVAADNPTAQALYRGAGYQNCGTRKGYYRRKKGRVDALLLQKKLA